MKAPAHALAPVQDRTMRALQRLVETRALLAPLRESEHYGVFAQGDRRRRPVARLKASEVKACLAEGLIEEVAEGRAFQLSAAGRAKARREAAPEDAFRAQHFDIVLREFLLEDGATHRVRAANIDEGVARLKRVTDGGGQPWFSPSDLAAARRVRADWNDGQAGLLRGSDLCAPPIGSTARGPGGAQDFALASAIDARARLSAAMAELTPIGQRVVSALCLEDMGFEAFETAQRWPARSAKLALKLALESLAHHYGVA